MRRSPDDENPEIAASIAPVAALHGTDVKEKSIKILVAPFVDRALRPQSFPTSDTALVFTQHFSSAG